MKNINVIGGGELASQFVQHIRTSFPNATFSFFDDVHHGEDIYPFNSYNHHLSTGPFMIALGYNHLAFKKKIGDQIIAASGKMFTYVHPTTFISPSCQVGYGSFIYPLCNIDKEVEVGNNCLINNSVVISHNCKIGKACYISPGVIISGNVTMGDCCFVGSGSVISNNVVIGDNVTVGIGTVITMDIPSDVSVIGNPMRITSRPVKLV